MFIKLTTHLNGPTTRLNTIRMTMKKLKIAINLSQRIRERLYISTSFYFN